MSLLSKGAATLWSVVALDNTGSEHTKGHRVQGARFFIIVVIASG